MMKKIIYLLFFSLLIVSCSSEDDDDVIDDNNIDLFSTQAMETYLLILMQTLEAKIPSSFANLLEIPKPIEPFSSAILKIFVK